MANKGEEKLLCPFLLSVGVTPRSLAYDDAVAAANSIKTILAVHGLSEVEVAFVEMVNKLSVGGPKLMSLDPIADPVPEYRKHFSSTLGLSIAPKDMPWFEGTGAIYFRLSSKTNDITLLTYAHVVHPPPAFPNNAGMTRTSNSQDSEHMIALGHGATTGPSPA
ncbi:hypothetical protein CPB84DRAFT_1794697 [Gymnopilus junonius]|uniref:Uncharacterized protein n=1 Tax=Gymnopilus junonius TaxID=109634 RepID=A0A9P5THR7_GYMJU|nr:hypothetical protein CPB84DRAFT_1794697 [Gymnopilus junonius]